MIYSTPALSGGGLLVECKIMHPEQKSVSVSFCGISAFCVEHVERFMLLALRIIRRSARGSLSVVFVLACVL